MPDYTREDVTFDSWGRRCAAWLYRPDGAAEGIPCVVMAHGWTGIREARLDAFAERFAAAGLGVVCFDYRHFGASEGTPRQLLSIRRQHEDYASALTFARALPWVDADRIVLWGTSFSGGHVQHMAAIDQRVAAVIANVPFTDGLKTLLRLGVGHSAKLTVEGLKDVATILRRRPPHMVASVGPPGSTAVMVDTRRRARVLGADPGRRRVAEPGGRPDRAARRPLPAGAESRADLLPDPLLRRRRRCHHAAGPRPRGRGTGAAWRVAPLSRRPLRPLRGAALQQGGLRPGRVPRRARPGPRGDDGADDRVEPLSSEAGRRSGSRRSRPRGPRSRRSVPR